MDHPRVLVVEDSPAVLRLITTVLEGGFEVIAAPDSATALSLVGSSAIDVVLTDVRMPGASGFEVLRAAQDRAPRAAVVMMTAYANVPDAVAAMRLGAFDYVAKPLEADEIVLVVARAAEHAREARPSGPVELPTGTPPPGADESELAVGFRRAVEEARCRASREYLTKLLQAFDGNVTQAAKRAGMTRESLHRVLKRFGVRAEHHKEHADGRESTPPASPGMS